MVLVELRQLLRIVSKFAMYFQAVWVIFMWMLLRPEDISLCALPNDGGTTAAWPNRETVVLRTFEAIAFATMYALVVGQIWVVIARCRVAAPLYAVPVEELVSDSSGSSRSRPLYCGSLGLVEGCHAPTRMCDWDALGAARDGLRWRDRCAMRACADALAAREAHLLSHLDALELRIGEAQLEAAQAAEPQGLQEVCPGLACTYSGLFTPLVLLLSMALMRGWRPSCQPLLESSSLSASDSGVSSGGLLEAVLWASVLLRAGQCWSIIKPFSSAAEAASETFKSPDADVASMRQQAVVLHQSLAETHRMVCSLELHFDRLAVPVARPRCGAGSFGSAGLGDAWAAGDSCWRDPSAVRALAIGWLGSTLVAFPSLTWPLMRG
jgi:hypothetical protein